MLIKIINNPKKQKTTQQKLSELFQISPSGLTAEAPAGTLWGLSHPPPRNKPPQRGAPEHNRHSSFTWAELAGNSSSLLRVAWTARPDGLKDRKQLHSQVRCLNRASGMAEGWPGLFSFRDLSTARAAPSSRAVTLLHPEAAF